MSGLFQYLSFRGRINRQRYWLTSLSIFGLLLVSGLLASMLSVLPLLELAIVPVWLALGIAGIATGVRRLHDRNKSGWWLMLFAFLPALLSFPTEVAQAGPVGLQALAAILALLGLPFSLWGLVEMGFLKGTAGPNKHGSDPRAPATEEVFA